MNLALNPSYNELTMHAEVTSQRSDNENFNLCFSWERERKQKAYFKGFESIDHCSLKTKGKILNFEREMARAVSLQRRREKLPLMQTIGNDG